MRSHGPTSGLIPAAKFGSMSKRWLWTLTWWLQSPGCPSRWIPSPSPASLTSTCSCSTKLRSTILRWFSFWPRTSTMTSVPTSLSSCHWCMIQTTTSTFEQLCQIMFRYWFVILFNISIIKLLCSILEADLLVWRRPSCPTTRCSSLQISSLWVSTGKGRFQK